MQPKETQLDWKEYIQVISNQDRSTAVENYSSDTLKALPKEEKRNRSNKTHYSPADPDARMAKKKGKPCRLYHLASMSVDTFRHVITHIRADFADENRRGTGFSSSYRFSQRNQKQLESIGYQHV